MKTLGLTRPLLPSAIVTAAGAEEGARPEDGAPAESAPAQLQRARSFAEPLLAGRRLDTGEDAWGHAEGVAAIVAGIGAREAVQASAYLVYAADFLQQPRETIARAFGESQAGLVEWTRKLVSVQRATREAGETLAAEAAAQQHERVRKMLLAFSRDLRVVLLRLASRLQTLRWHAEQRHAPSTAVAQEALQVFAPLASRLGIWQIKWELEDLAFRFLQPEPYRDIARRLQDTRAEREVTLEFVRHQLAGVLRAAGLNAEVQGRPKHIYSIWKKMQGKGLPFERVFDVRAVRVVLPSVADCYAALSVLQQRYRDVPGEFDDYIANPKPNGYRSLHLVLLGDDTKPLEVQLRTQAMHEHAEHGVAAHWAYKEAGSKGYAGVQADAAAAQQVAEARKAVMQQLLAWERDVAQREGAPAQAGEDSHIYVLTPQSTVVELPVGATPIDFAYAVHTALGHRCRGARVDGALVPLGTPLRNGQTVEITTVKEGGPSLDWLNPELGFLRSPRSRAKVRAWFNAQAQEQTIARGREMVERLLQREGRTGVKLDDLAARVGQDNAARLFEAVGKEELPLRQIEAVLRPATPPAPGAEDAVPVQRAKATGGGGQGVLVVGVESLLTGLARCCRPAPPDAIGGYVTRGKGVAIHRADCSNFRHLARAMPERLVPVAWAAQAPEGAQYALDIAVEGADRTGLLRDVSEVLAKERVRVTAVQVQTVREAAGPIARLSITLEMPDAARLPQVLRQVAAVRGVLRARRR